MSSLSRSGLLPSAICSSKADTFFPVAGSERLEAYHFVNINLAVAADGLNHPKKVCFTIPKENVRHRIAKAEGEAGFLQRFLLVLGDPVTVAVVNVDRLEAR
jgi:hypothetical protein